jgi:secondary thiamine-phosphate synthase enzyme
VRFVIGIKAEDYLATPPAERIGGVRLRRVTAGTLARREATTRLRFRATIHEAIGNRLAETSRMDQISPRTTIEASVDPNESMRSLTEHLWFEVPQRRGYLNITETVADLVRRSGVQEGLCLVNAMHITASVYVNDDEQGLLHDYDVWLEKLAPHEPTTQYRHNRTGEDNADAHLKRQIMGREVVVAITQGRLDLGPWEQIFYGEFDGRRRKRVLVKIIGD